MSNFIFFSRKIKEHRLPQEPPQRARPATCLRTPAAEAGARHGPDADPAGSAGRLAPRHPLPTGGPGPLCCGTDTGFHGGLPERAGRDSDTGSRPAARAPPLAAPPALVEERPPHAETTRAGRDHRAAAAGGHGCRGPGHGPARRGGRGGFRVSGPTVNTAHQVRTGASPFPRLRVDGDRSPPRAPHTGVAARRPPARATPTLFPQLPHSRPKLSPAFLQQLLRLSHPRPAPSPRKTPRLGLGAPSAGSRTARTGAPRLPPVPPVAMQPAPSMTTAGLARQQQTPPPLLPGGPCSVPPWHLMARSRREPTAPDGPRPPALQPAPEGSGRKAGGPAWLGPVSGSAVGAAGSAGPWWRGPWSIWRRKRETSPVVSSQQGGQHGASG